MIDVRTPSERERSHRSFPAKLDILQIPFLTEIDPEWEHQIDQSPIAVAGRYLDMLARQGRRALRSIVTAITPDRLPMVIHCSAGKDRTGIVMAILLAIAGVPDEAIAADYAKSGSDLQLLASDPATAGILAPTRRTNTKRRQRRCGYRRSETAIRIERKAGDHLQRGT